MTGPQNHRISWSRVLVEGIVIVASILLAFAIDASWDARQDRIRLIEHLEALAEDVREAKADISLSQSARERRIEVIRSLLDVITGAEARPSADTLNSWLGSMWGARSPLTPFAALDDLRASGVLASIESPTLREALFDYARGEVDLIEGEQRLIRGWVDGLQPYLIARSDALPQMQAGRALGLEGLRPTFESDIDAMLADRTFQNLLLSRLNRTVTVHRDADALLAVLERIRSSLEEAVR